MKKLTAMLLSLMMCFSLMAIPAQAALTLDPDGPGIIDAGGKKGHLGLGGDDSDEPGYEIQGDWPYPRDDLPRGGDC